MAGYFVYLIQAQQNYVKIGFTRDVARRLKTMQTGNPHPLKLVLSFPFDTKAEAMEMERLLHLKLSKWNIHGEWFDYKMVKKKLRFEVNGHKIPTNKYLTWRAEALVP